MENMEFVPQQIDAAYVNALVQLINACREYEVEIENVCFFQNGWHVTFRGFDGADAICHDHSYGSPCYFGKHHNDWSNKDGEWETIGFPWDEDDVSVHTARELAFFIESLKNGLSPWNEDEEPDFSDDVNESNYNPYMGCDDFECGSFDEGW